MDEYDPHAVEEKWRQHWAEANRYESDPDDNDATLITVPYTYPSGGMHIGHARTYTLPDVIARYRRLQGDTVLYPMGWHVTGTPIIGAVERLKKGEEQQLSVLRDTYEVPKDTLNSLETPMGFARYFIEEHYKNNMQALGLSIDWRREFTTDDDRYQRFIEWQYKTLYERGLLEQGLHPVKYCQNEDQPVTTHDILEGEETDFQEYSLVRFRHEKGEISPANGDAESTDAVVPMATLRPETVQGVTNAFVDPDGEYVRATVDGESWIVSADAAEKLRLQAHDVTETATFMGESLVGEYVTNPVTNERVVILPAGFVDTDGGTGVVMSVPAHSPDDWVALHEAKANVDQLADYNINSEEVRSLEPIPILATDDYGDVPAQDIVEQRGIESSDDPSLADATQDLYEHEFHHGRLGESYDDYANKVVESVRDDLREDYREQGVIESMYDFPKEVVCRCGGDVEVAEQESWFLRYNDDDWKEKACQAVEQLEAIPENTRDQYYHTIDWLNEWPCIRNFGLGTRLPWDDNFVIEPLSDSTIYPAYYTIAHRLKEIPVDDLDREFFDALFYGPEAINGNPDDRALQLREEWQYWYPVDVRMSANDLIENHLTFYLYHHAELFDEPMWPEGITIMGMGLLDGEGMSSSRGNVVLPGNAISEYGADAVRLFLLNSSEPWRDYNWRDELVANTHDQLERFYSQAKEVIQSPNGERDLKHIDRWLLAKLQRAIEQVTDAMDSYETRKASQAVFHSFEGHLRWYHRRTDLDRPGARWTRRRTLKMRLRLLAPFIPFLTNEIHEQLTGEPAEDANWPEPASIFKDRGTEIKEELIKGLTEDIRDIIEVTDTEPEKIRVYTAADWKWRVFEQIGEIGPDTGAVMNEVMTDDQLRERGNAVNDLVSSLVERIRGRDTETLKTMSEVNERAIYGTTVNFFENEFDATVELHQENDDTVDSDVAENAEPLRPAIYIE